jgi:hypothetical protein
MNKLLVNIRGGLGNQMFQYAFGLSLNAKLNVSLEYNIHAFASYGLHNDYELDDVFNINATYISLEESNKYLGYTKNKSNITSFKEKVIRFFNKAMRRWYVHNGYLIIENKAEEFRYIDRKVNITKHSVFMKGYWQSYKYIESVDRLLLNEFKFPELVSEKNKDLRDFISTNLCVSIHVRRGDYLNFQKFSNICTSTYYSNAISLVKEKLANICFIVFSDDIDWCKKNLDCKDSITKYVDWNSGNNSYIDMQLMSICDHNIIANSTFSWWGAWLNQNNKKIVIAPNKWIGYESDTCDLIPPTWKKCGTD